MREIELKLPEPVPSLQSADAFVERYGGIYEHSPWVALRTWERGLTSSADTVEGLAAEMAKTLASASRDEQLALILAHPDLAGRAAKQGELTPDSTDEQSSAGLDQCTAEELKRFHTLNDSYKNKFQFPLSWLFVALIAFSFWRHSRLESKMTRRLNLAERSMRSIKLHCYVFKRCAKANNLNVCDRQNHIFLAGMSSQQLHERESTLQMTGSFTHDILER